MAFLLFRAVATTCGIVVFERRERNLDLRDAARTSRKNVTSADPFLTTCPTFV